MTRSPRIVFAFGPAALGAAMWTQAVAGPCGFQPAFDRPDEGGASVVRVFQGEAVPALGNVRPLLFITSLAASTDRTAISYHQDDPNGLRCQSDPGATPCAIGSVRNAYRDPRKPEALFGVLREAGYPNPRTWDLLSPDVIEKSAATGKPCVTPDGYLVSMTADVAVSGGFGRVGDCDPSKWIDALTVPSIAIPKNSIAAPSQFVQLGLVTRSLVVAASGSATRRVVPGIVGELGPTDEIGVASVAMNRALNGLPDGERPRHRQDVSARFQTTRTAVLLLPGAELVLARPISAARVAQAGAAALARFGGADKLYACIRDEIDPDF